MSSTTAQNENQESPSIIYPEDTTVFSFQVSGHVHGKGKHKWGVLKHKNGDVVKPLFEDHKRSILELSFYETVFQNSQCDPLLNEIKSYLPSFHGIWETSVCGKDMKYLCLEDVCGSFQNPSVLDIKIGCVTYDIQATKEKISEETAKYEYGPVTGFRIIGLKVYNDKEQMYITPEKVFYKKVSLDSLRSVLEMYLTSNVLVNICFLCGFIHKLLEIDEWFSKQRKFVFAASSILFVYEGTLSSWLTWIQNNNILNLCQIKNSARHNSDCDSFCKLLCEANIASNSETNDICTACEQNTNFCNKICKTCSLFRVTMIDFAHCYPYDKEDTNYIFGLQSLIKYIKDMLKLQLEKYFP